MADDVSKVRDRQRRQALVAATASKKRRKKMKDRIREGKIDPYALVVGSDEHWEPYVRKWRVEQLLALVPGIGPVGRVEIYKVAKLSPRTQVGALDYERREHLAKLCRQYAEGD